MTRDVLILGGTGYVGRALSARLARRGHRVRVLARPGSLARVTEGVEAVAGNALDAASVAAAVRAGDVVVQLVGTPHPSPAKARQFREVDLAAIEACVDAVRDVPISHLVYVSVAHPAPVMHAYIEVRAHGERLIREARIRSIVLRPWYVLGPGHRWPLALVPLYALASLVPSLREGASRLGLVTLEQMVSALVAAVEAAPPVDALVVGVPGIRAATAGGQP